MRFLAVVLLLPLVLMGPLALRAVSEENSKEKLRLVEELMGKIREAEARAGPEQDLSRFFAEEGKHVLRVYNVADLTVRLTNFIAPQLEVKPAGAEIDESQPLFGKAEEGEIFFAGVEELMDLIQMNVSPEVWESGGRLSPSGPNALIVVADRETQDAVARYLGRLRESLGRIVTVEVRVLELKAGSGLLPPGAKAVALSRAKGLELLERAETGKEMRIVHSARLTGFSGERVALSRIAQVSFVQDYDVEVAQEAKISDPIVSVLQTGISFDLRSTVRGEEQVILDLRAQISALREPLRAVETLSGPVQMPDVALATLSTSVTVPDRGFALVGAGDSPNQRSWALLLSPVVERIRTAGKGGAK